MPLPTTKVTASQVADAKRLAGANWHTLSPTDTTKAIVLTGQGLLKPAVREPGASDGYLRCEVGQYTALF